MRWEELLQWVTQNAECWKKISDNTAKTKVYYYYNQNSALNPQGSYNADKSLNALIEHKTKKGVSLSALMINILYCIIK